MFNLISIEEAKSNLLKEKTTSVNFSKKITFQFPESYKELATQIKTAEISAECIIFNSIKSTNETKAFSDLDYWQKDIESGKVKEYWFFGANGQGDSWVLNQAGNVFFYDHNSGELSDETLINLSINFDQWLQFAFLNKVLEEIDGKGNLTPKLKEVYALKLEELSSGLAKNYPFYI